MPTGNMQIAGQLVQGTGPTFNAINPATGEVLAPAFGNAEDHHIDSACRAAMEAFEQYRLSSRGRRAEMLDMIAEEIVQDASHITSRAHLETGLPLLRLEGELMRTTNQLRLFARILRTGSFLDVRIDTAQPEREPVPRPDIRQWRVPLGPVAVFGASNFPLAFSVAGGDTASALAAGAPVICKAHPAHPGTSELTARAVARGIQRSGQPAGIFSLLCGQGHQLGTSLVRHPAIAAVGFTGSRSGGQALMKVASYRPVPIPVYAEMSSINPVVLLPAALNARADAIANEFVAAMSLGAGQFCTNPGLVIAIESPGLTLFEEAATRAVLYAQAQTMLTPGIHQSFQSGLRRWSEMPSVSQLAIGHAGKSSSDTTTNPGCIGKPCLYATTANQFINSSELAEEIFGPVSLIVRCQNGQELKSVLASLEGQLTATLQLDAEDHAFARDLLPVMEARAGRILCNSFPTGVEVSNAMVHGGPFPATSDGRSTSVGAAAIERFLRPVCYQNIPDGLLPDALKRDNPEQVPRAEDVYD